MNGIFLFLGLLIYHLTYENKFHSQEIYELQQI